MSRKSKPHFFLSYSSRDQARAQALVRAFDRIGVEIWKDRQSISGGAEWAQAIEVGIRGADAAVVLVSKASAKSAWVAYEYAYAKGADIPIVAVLLGKVTLPTPLQRFQAISYVGPTTAKEVYKGFKARSKMVGLRRGAEPRLMARFQEVDGEIVSASDDEIPALCMDLWMENVPPSTTSVSFEILDLSFGEGGKWTLKRKKSRRQGSVSREFLTTDMNSYGDVEIWAGGSGDGNGTWTTSTRLYDALLCYYSNRPKSSAITEALAQIREN